MYTKDYTAQVARIRAIESRLLTSGQVERMLGASDAAAAFKILNDLDWADFLGETDKPEEFVKVIDAGLLEVRNVIVEMLEDESDFDFLWLLFDLHNAKVLLKSFFKDEDPDTIIDYLSRLGSLTRGQMRRIVYEEIKIQRHPWILDIIRDIKRDYEKNSDPENIEIILQREFFPRILDQAKNIKSELILKFYQVMIDIENTKTFLRRLNNEKELTTHSFINGGVTDISIFSEAVNIEGLIDNIKDRHIYELLKNEISSEEKLNHQQIEKVLDEYLFSILKPSILESQDPEPIFAFFWIKYRNAEIIRSIMVGKLNNIDENQIRSWLKTPSLSFV